MSLNKLTNIQSGIDAGFDIKAESLRCDGNIVENKDESLLTTTIPTKIYTTSILSTSGTDGVLTWDWQLSGAGYICYITTTLPLSSNYCVFTCPKAFVDPVRNCGVVKLNNESFICSFMRAVSGSASDTLLQGEFSLTLIYSA